METSHSAQPPTAYPRPKVRPLKIYAFDPTIGKRLNNYMTIAVPYEDVQPGPIGEYIAVIDYDGSNNQYYRAVDLQHPSLLIGGGLDLNESDPMFHQQMVYAVVMETIKRFEFALGRPIKWRADRRPADAPHKGRLLVLPHAFQQANAYYDSSQRALLFGYFAATASDVGDNLPGQTVFTCLSHDIIAHETTHALVDGLRDFFMQPTNPDVGAFHEAFADIVALFQHFSYQEALLDTIQRTGGLIYREQLKADAVSQSGKARIGAERRDSNPLIGLAEQFGQAVGMRGALRSALNTDPDPLALGRATEPHERGAILVAAVFDAYFSIYVKKTRDLMRIARACGTCVDDSDMHPDLAKRLAAEAAALAKQFVNLCVRALDYCPPMDIQFGEFLRAIVTADADLVPDDPWDYRGELIKAFRLRGVIPEDVTSYSEEALRWCGPAEIGSPVSRCEGLSFEFHHHEPDEVLKARRGENATVLHRWALQNSGALGLAPDLKTQVHSFHPLHRVGPDGQLMTSFVAIFAQSREERLFADEPAPTFDHRGGATVIFDHRGTPQYVITKSIQRDTRLKRIREYLITNGASAALRFTEPGAGLSFSALHGGY